MGRLTIKPHIRTTVSNPGLTKSFGKLTLNPFLTLCKLSLLDRMCQQEEIKTPQTPIELLDFCQ